MTISKDRVMPSPMPDSWNLAQIFATGVGFGTYLAITSVVFFWAMYKTTWFSVSNTAGLTTAVSLDSGFGISCSGTSMADFCCDSGAFSLLCDDQESQKRLGKEC